MEQPVEPLGGVPVRKAALQPVVPGSCSSSPRCFRSRHSERYWFRAIWHSHTRSWQSPRNWSMEANARKKVSWVTSSAVWASRLRARM